MYTADVFVPDPELKPCLAIGAKWCIRCLDHLVSLAVNTYITFSVE